MRRLREALLTVGAVLGARCLLLGLLAVTAGVHVLVFRSGSMSPTIATGDLALTRTVPASELRVDDVVSVIDSGGNRVTHRVVNIAEQGDQRQLTMRGDANEQPDSEIYTVNEAQRVFFVVPKAGLRRRVVDRSGRSGAVGRLRSLPALGAAASQGARRRRRARSDSHGSRSAEAPCDATTSAPWGAGVACGGPRGSHGGTCPRGLGRAVDRPVAVSGTSFTAYTVTKPAIVSCTVSGGALAQKTARITWTAVSSPFALDYTAVIFETGQSMTVSTVGATKYVDFSAGLLSTVLNSTYNIRITAKLPSPNGCWTSAVDQPTGDDRTAGCLSVCGTAT